jgi:hypothetical protein
MKNNITIIIAFLMTLSFLPGCKNEHNPIVPQNSPDVIIPPTTKILPSSDVSDQLESISSDLTTFVFRSGVAAIDNLSVNDIMVSNNGQGILRKIISVTKNNNKIIIITTQACLEDAIQKGKLSITHTLSPNDTMQVLLKAKGVSLNKNTLKHSGFYISMNDVVIYDADGNLGTTDDQVVANGSVSISQGFDFTLSIDNWTLTELLMTTTFSEDIQLGVNMNLLNLSYTKEKEIYRVSFTPLTFFIGIVPVVITPVLSISVGIDGKIYADLFSSISQHADFTAGIEYENTAWSKLANESHSFSYQIPTITAGAELKGYVGPNLNFLLYGVIGPSVNVSLYGKVVADPTQTPQIALWEGIAIDAGVKIEVLSHVVAGYQANVLDLKTKIWESSTLLNQSPNIPASPKPTDNSTSVSKSPTLSWTCSDPDRDPLTYDVYFGTIYPPTTKVSSDQSATSLARSGLADSTTYYWKVIAKDNHSKSTPSPVWQFTSM